MPYKKIFIAVFLVLFCAASVNADVVATYLLDESSGTREDDTGSADFTTADNVTTATDRASQANSCLSMPLANAAHLKTANDPSNLDFNGASGYFSISMWVYPLTDSASTPSVLMAKSNAGFTVNQYYIFLDTDLTVDFYTQGGVLTSSSSLTASQWNHIICTYDGSYKRIFIDGNTTADASVADTSGCTDENGPAYLGLTTASYSWVYLDDILVANHAATATDINNWYNYNANTWTVADTITITEHDDNRVYSRTPGGTSGSITIAGTYTGSPTNIEYSTDDGSNWDTLVTSPTGGTFSQAVTVDCGGPYSAQVRFSNDTDVNDTEENEWYVGAVFVLAGQSNMATWTTSQTGWTSLDVTVNDDIMIAEVDKNSEAWVDCAYPNCLNGAGSFADTIGDELSIPVGLIQTAVSGSALRSEAEGSYGYWWDESTDDPGTHYLQMETIINDNDGDIEGIVWFQGEQDALDTYSVSTAEYTDSLQKMIAESRSDFGSTLPWIVVPIGRFTVGGADFAKIREAIYDVATADQYTFIGTDAITYSLYDYVHITNTDSIDVGERCAVAMLYALGEVTCYRGPRILGYEIVDTTYIDIVTDLDCGTTLAEESSSYTGFTVDGGPSITDASRQTASTIRLTISGGTGSVTGIHYLDGNNPTITDAVYDDNDYPLEFQVDLIEYDPPTCAISTPTSDSTYSAGWTISDQTLTCSGDGQTVTIAGSASDVSSVEGVSWACPTCSTTSGDATGTTSWTFDVVLGEGSNTITVTAIDDTDFETEDVLTVTYDSTYGITPSTPYGDGDVMRFFYSVTSRDSGSGGAYVGGYFNTTRLINQVGSYQMDLEVADYTEDVEFTFDTTNGWDGVINLNGVMMDRKQDN